MKKILKVLGIIFLLLIALVIILPFVFKGKIVGIVKQEINKNLQAKVDFESASLSLLSSFPDFTLTMNELEIVGLDKFENDTLLKTNKLQLTIDIKSVFQGSPYTLKQIILESPSLNIVTLKDGAVNYDISVPDASSENANSNEESSFVLALKEVKISDGKLMYDDRSMDFLLKINDLNGTMAGDLAADQSELTTDLTAESLIMSYENLVLLSNVKAIFNAVISANLEQDIYIIKSNRLLLNDLVIEFVGTFGLNEDDIAMDFNFTAPNGDFKQLLSLIPAIYSADFNNVSTAGDFVFDGYMKGSYSESAFPGFGMNLNIKNAQFSYPDLPNKIENIEVVTAVSNETGDFDATYINVEKFNFKMAGNPFESHLKVKTPVSNPNIDLGLKGTLDFGSLTSILPKEAISDLKGVFVFDFALKSLLSDIENGAYQNMYANGVLFINDFETSVAAFDLPIKMKKAEFNFTPSNARMQIEKLNLGSSDLSGTGQMANYLSYILGDGVVDGTFAINSNLLNINELMKAMPVEESEITQTDSIDTPMILPDNIVLAMNANALRLIYEDYELSNVKAVITYKNKQIDFKPLSADLLGGSVVLQGSYDGKEPTKPAVDMDFKVIDFDIPLAYQTIGLFQTAAPIAEKAKGKFSTSFKLKGNLDSQMNPLYETLQGGGGLQSTQITIESGNVMNQLASLLGNEKYKRLITDGVNFSFEFINGKVFQKPFNIKYAGTDVTLGGSIGFDQQLDYNMLFKIPYSQLGTNVSKGIDVLVAKAGSAGIKFDPGTSVQINAKIIGAASDPKVSIDFKDYAGNLKDNITNTALLELEKQKEQLKGQVKDGANKLIEEARQQGDELIRQAELIAANIRSEATKAANIVRNEANIQANKLVVEGKANGLIAEKAAIKVADKIRQQAEINAVKIEQEADKKADGVINEARTKSDQIMLKAQQKADGI